MIKNDRGVAEIAGNSRIVDEDIDKFISLYEKLQKKYGEKAKEILLARKGGIFVPVSIFAAELSCLELIVKYLRENLGMEFTKIADAMNRSSKTVWQAYSFASKKHKGALNVGSADMPAIQIPVSIFKNRKLSMLENLVKYIKENYGLRFSKIAELLHRNQRTIWTVYSRALKKEHTGKEHQGKEHTGT